MRRALPAVAAALLTAAGFGLALALPGHDADASVVITPTATLEQRFGIIRFDTGARRWAILSTATYRPSGLTGVSCSAATGRLTVGFTPLGTIGTFTVDEDEAYAGRYEAGASVTAGSMTIVIRKRANGATVPCNARELRIAGSNLQLWIAGTAQPVASPTPTRPNSGPVSPGPTTKPTSGPPPEPSESAGTELPPTFAPTVIPDE